MSYYVSHKLSRRLEILMHFKFLLTQDCVCIGTNLIFPLWYKKTHPALSEEHLRSKHLFGTNPQLAVADTSPKIQLRHVQEGISRKEKQGGQSSPKVGRQHLRLQPRYKEREKCCFAWLPCSLLVNASIMLPLLRLLPSSAYQGSQAFQPDCTAVARVASRPSVSGWGC